MTRRIVIATKNPDKLVEFKAVLAGVEGLEIVEGHEWDDVDETGDTLEANAILKAEAVVAATRMDALADDTGLEVDALDGAPGVRSARYSGAGATYQSNRLALLRALDGVAERAARFRTAMALVAVDGSTLVVEGSLEGRIATAERGAEGFGYDSIFELSDGRTLAEVGPLEKNRISHRARALQAVLRELSRDQ